MVQKSRQVENKKAGEEEKVFESRVRNQLCSVPFEDVKMEVKPPLREASDISDLKEEVKHEHLSKDIWGKTKSLLSLILRDHHHC